MVVISCFSGSMTAVFHINNGLSTVAIQILESIKEVEEKLITAMSPQKSFSFGNPNEREAK